MSLDLESIKSKLEARRAELLEQSDAHAEERKPVEYDQTTVGRLSRMDAIQDQAMAIESQRRRDVERHRIEAALERIEEGDYGHCVVCGADIAPKRLELDPAAPTCINCARHSDH